MIDKLPVISAKSDAVNSTNQLTAQSENDSTESFEAVLAKQVAQEETKQSKADQLAEDHAELMPSEGLDDQALLDGVIAPVESDGQVVAGFADAEALARKATNDSLEAATDGEVALVGVKDGTDGAAPPVGLSNVVGVQPSTSQAVPQATTETAHQTEAADKTGIANIRDTQQSYQSAGQRQQVADSQTAHAQSIGASAYQAKQEIAMNELAQSSPLEATAAITQQTAQLSSLQQSQAVAQVPGSSNMIQAYPGKTGWNEAISQKIVWMVGASEQSATLTLNPKDLGPLQVVIQVNNEKADATFISENPEVRKALEEGMSQLRQSMSQTGVELGQANVNSNRQQQAFQQNNSGRFMQSQTTGNDSQNVSELPTARQQTRVSNGLVDTFA